MKNGMILMLLACLVLPLPAEETYTWKELYEKALDSNPALAAKQEAASAAEYQWKSARRARGPAVYFESDLSYLTSPREVDLAAGSLYPGGPMGPVNFPALPETDVSLPLSGHEWYSFRLVLEQPLLTSGKLAGREKIQRALWETSLLHQDQEKVILKAEILTLVYSLSRLQEIVELIGQQGRAADRFVLLMKNSYDSGMASYSDLLGAQGRAREISLMENQARRQQNQALLNLKYLCGLETLTPAAVSREDLPCLTAETNLEGLKEEALGFSPVLRLMKKQIQIASQNLALVRGSSYGRPDLGLRVELDYAAGSRLFTSEDWGFDAANLTGTLGIRALLADAGKAFADVKTAESREAEARQRYREAEAEIKRSLEEEIFNQTLSRDNIEYYQLRAEDDLAVVEQKKQSWEAGFGGEQDYLQQLLSWYSHLIYGKQEEISLAASYVRMRALTGKPGE